jgi:hypothetical protein
MNNTHELERLKPITERIIGCAIEVHRHLGGGLLETTYESAMCIELEQAQLSFVRQPVFSVVYKGRTLGQHRAALHCRKRGDRRTQKRGSIRSSVRCSVADVLEMHRAAGWFMNQLPHALTENWNQEIGLVDVL